MAYPMFDKAPTVTKLTEPLKEKGEPTAGQVEALKDAKNAQAKADEADRNVIQATEAEQAAKTPLDNAHNKVSDAQDAVDALSGESAGNRVEDVQRLPHSLNGIDSHNSQ